jgi:coenzyme F420-reducing hydrogenase alpha subunit
VTRAHLDIYEPPRFFEGILRGRSHLEPPDITARICGICPVAHQLTASQAIEMACGVTVDGPIADLRRLLYCGEWIESHALHVYLLQAPDLAGVASAIELAAVDRAAVERGLRLLGAAICFLGVWGGGPPHPVNLRLGGFHRAPDDCDLHELAEELRSARDAALDTVRWVAGFDYPDVELDHPLVALRADDCYAIEQGRLVSSTGLDLAPHQFEDHVIEEQVEHSNALHARLVGEEQPYLVGPLARFCLNADHLSPLARDAAAEAGLDTSCRNPFLTIVVRAVEILYACDEAIRILDGYERPSPAAVDVPARAGTGCGWTEAPRGLLYHRYVLDTDGTVLAARIVPPTSQNQRAIEDDLARLVEGHLDLPTAELTTMCEQAIRSYDPCISCATHFLDLRLQEER